MFKLISLVIFIAASATTPAAAKNIMTDGTLTCATWATSRSSKRADILEGYLIGLMNGLALGSGTDFWDADGQMLERAQVLYWMDVYCQGHPLSDVTVGAITLMNERSNNAYSRRVSSY
jgi:hypothetical protein